MAPWRLPSAFREGVFRLSWSLDRRQSMVAIGDIVEVALLVLKEGQRHYGATYELCSEGRFTAYDIGETIGRVTGQSISVQEISADDYLTVLFGAGDRHQFAPQVSVLQSIIKRYMEHDLVDKPKVLT